ncbi:MAG: DUF2085 domain-containing protein [Candidatus Hodarchaeota archaeon]
MKEIIQRFKESEIHFVWCHRLPERSLCIKGTPIVCWRCLGIYLAVLACMLLPLGLLVGLSILVPNPYWFALAFFLMVPLAVDGLGQGLNYWTSTNPRRFSTGILYGLGFSLGMWAFTWYVWQLFKTL